MKEISGISENDIKDNVIKEDILEKELDLIGVTAVEDIL